MVLHMYSVQGVPINRTIYRQYGVAHVFGTVCPNKQNNFKDNMVLHIYSVQCVPINITIKDNMVLHVYSV